VADFNVPLEWLAGLAADKSIPLEYAVVVRFRYGIPTEWWLEGFTPFQPDADKCTWQAICAPVTFHAEPSSARWQADPEEVAQAYAVMATGMAEPATTVWTAEPVSTNWTAAEGCGQLWVADPPCKWIAAKSNLVWTADAMPV
jgi:hypothetical protein